ncbi:MAG: hypothetical protein KIT11_05505 [Fimbriimonadaceae bacterium]|nr:hypothetical protein [Fimbriimonadaceae bacterium]QYK56651.1 MAG: hypothetical protein KF733_04015 [Fimbriimonadaceae bacterium]
MLRHYRLPVALVKQLVAALLAVVAVFIVSIVKDPKLAEALVSLAGVLLPILAFVTFGVDAAGLAIQNAQGLNDEDTFVKHTDIAKGR